MRRYVLTLMVIAISSILLAQDGIHFSKGSWIDILEKAKNENKNVFLDCYTSWCGPCKKMSAEVFTLKEVGDSFNPNFVSVKMDMEKGEGIKLNKAFKISVYPTLIIFNGDGEELHRFVGYKTGDELLLEAKKVYDRQTFAFTGEKYEAGNREPEFVKSYMDELKSSRKKDELSAVAEDYLVSLGSEKWESEECWTMIKTCLNDKTGNSPIIRYVQKNKDTYITLYGEKDVNSMLNRIFYGTAKSFTITKNNKTVVDTDAFHNYISDLKELNVKGAEALKDRAEMFYAIECKQWKKYVTNVEDLIKAKGDDIGEQILYYHAYQIEVNCDDKDTRKVALKWCKLAMEVAKTDRYKKRLQKTHDLLIADKTK